MKVLRHFVRNSLGNIHYLAGCEATRQAVAIDPIDAGAILALAREQGWKIIGILNTHGHSDHIAGNGALVEATGAWIAAPKEAGIASVDRLLQPEDGIEVGNHSLTALSTPGHIFPHFCFLSDTDALFSGDALFHAGVGNTYGGNSMALHKSIGLLQKRCAPQTQVYPGHDYFGRNLLFALKLEPDNTQAKAWLEKVQASEVSPVATLADEQTYNPFLRLDSPAIRKATGEEEPAQVFCALRKLRDRW